ncbi:cobyric acid synthase [Gottschalkiaceae bacterium SANA]|nr:cobyric acid synthase [Gottschalkiaceae bacterium SANA]
MKLMVQGTGSSVGKSLLVAGFCRLLKNEGVSVAPYKSQNMALNAWVTKDGLEMGRAQAVQAEAAGIAPHVDMNPILLKPNRSLGAQVIVEGRAKGHFPALEYEWMKPGLKQVAKRSFDRLASRYDAILIEGAGSPVEINLRKNDLVNMGFAEMVNAPVVLVADIDRGGVFAQLVGTMTLLSPEEKKRVKGYIINKFRGDQTLLMPGIEMVKKYMSIPCLGVVPYMEGLLIDDEDSVTTRIDYKKKEVGLPSVGIVQYPHASNLSDFTPLEMEDGITLHYVKTPEEITSMDAIILPGSKHTLHDLNWLKETGCVKALKKIHKAGLPILGICGGYQILGRQLEDSMGVEGKECRETGLGLLNVRTRMDSQKTTQKSNLNWDNHVLQGYEIHQGVTEPIFEKRHWMENERKECLGMKEAHVMGTYLHGLFENASFREWFLEEMGANFGNWEYQTKKEESYNRWAAHLEACVDWPMIHTILEESESL